MNILIIGANSAIATAVARLYAERHAALFLIARDQQRLARLAAELSQGGASRVGQQVLDLTDSSRHEDALTEAMSWLEGIDIALICHGSLPDQEFCETDFAEAARQIDINGLSVISLLTVLSRQLKQQGNGTIAVITSVAGDRGRQPNFVYGAAKSMVSTYLQGLRGKLHAHNVHVVDIRPGLVDSPMTAHLEKGPLWSTPELVARNIVTAIDRGRHTVYTPSYWRIIMATVSSIPDFLFKRIKF